MLSVDAARAASTKQVEVIDRVCLWSGGIVRIRVQKDARAGTYENGEISIPFLMFPFNVEGGRINGFVHTDDNSLAGKLITAQLLVMRKVLGDGREFLYLDFIPVESSTPVTHKVVVASRAGQYEVRPDWVVFETPPPLSSWVVITPPGVKVGGPNTGEVVVPKPKTPKVTVVSTGDPVLDRLTQREGWFVGEEANGVVTLFKWKGGVQKFLNHHRRKSRT